MKQLPQGWESKALGQLVSVSYGKGLREVDRSGTGEFPVVGSSGVVGTHNVALVDGPVVVVGRKGNVGTAYLADKPSWPIDTTYYLSMGPALNARFLTYQINHLELNRLDSSTAIPSLRRPDLESAMIALPQFEEQQRIVEVIEEEFSRLDAATESLKRAKRNLTRFRASILRTAFEGRLVPEDPTDESAITLVESIAGRRPQNESVGLQVPWMIPSNWCWSRMGALFDVFVGATPPRGVPANWNGDLPWVSSGEVAFNRIHHTRETISREGIGSNRLHPPGTVLLGMIGEGKTRGQAALLEVTAAHNQNSAAIRVGETPISPVWVYLFLTRVYEDTRRVGSGNNQPALNKARVQALPICIPPVAEQLRIVAEVERQFSIIDAMAKTIDASLARANTLRQSILGQAFSGKLTGAA